MAEFIRSAIVYLRALFAALLSAALVCIFALPFAFPLGGVFRGGEGGSKKRGVYTLYSASSSGCFTDNPDFLQLLAVRGEAAVYELSAENSASREEILNAVSKKLNAEVRFTEEAGGAVSYYCYSDKIGAARAKKNRGLFRQSASGVPRRRNDTRRAACFRRVLSVAAE